jgi:hypothetical protein
MRNQCPDSPAAIFIFKNDGRNQSAWDSADEVAEVLIQHEVQKSIFLDGLREWHRQLDKPWEYAHLAIYSHSFQLGISVDADGSEPISWAELNAALPRRVATLWLVGCRTEYALRAWPRPADSPVSKSLLVTNASLDWERFLPLFRNEVSLEGFSLYDQMASRLRTAHAKLGAEVTYLDAKGPKWTPFPEPAATSKPLPSETIASVNLQSLWPTSEPDDESDAGEGSSNGENGGP